MTYKYNISVTNNVLVKVGFAKKKKMPESIEDLL